MAPRFSGMREPPILWWSDGAGLMILVTSRCLPISRDVVCLSTHSHFTSANIQNIYFSCKYLQQSYGAQMLLLIFIFRERITDICSNGVQCNGLTIYIATTLGLFSSDDFSGTLNLYYSFFWKMCIEFASFLHNVLLSCVQSITSLYLCGHCFCNNELNSKTSKTKIVPLQNLAK